MALKPKNREKKFFCKKINSLRPQQSKTPIPAIKYKTGDAVALTNSQPRAKRDGQKEQNGFSSGK